MANKPKSETVAPPKVKRPEDKNLWSMFDHLEEAGLTMNNIILVNPIAIEVCVNDKKFLKGMPDKYQGRTIKYTYLDEKQVTEINQFRAGLNARNLIPAKQNATAIH